MIVRVDKVQVLIAISMQESTQMLCNFSMGYMSLFQMVGC